MSALIEVILPVFLVLGFGYLAVWKGFFSQSAVDGLMKFAQNFAVPCLLFSALSRLDLGATFDWALLTSFYGGAFTGFLAGLTGALVLFGRPRMDAVAIGFSTLFSNSVLLGLPITERAYGAGALGPNYAIIAVHAPFCYIVGVTAMEMARARGTGVLRALGSVPVTMARNPLVIAIALGLVVNLAAIPLPGVLVSAIDMMVRAALPAALFALGGVLVQYRPEGDMRIVLYIAGVSLILHPAVVWGLGRVLDLNQGQFRSAVLTAAMAPGVNTYLFANMFGVARRVAASAVLIATALSVLTAWGWLSVLA